MDNTAGHLSSPGVPPKSFWPGRREVGLRTSNQCFRALSFHGVTLHGAPGASGCSSLLYPVATPGRYCEGGAGVVSPQSPHISSAGRKKCLLWDNSVAGFVLIVAYNKQPQTQGIVPSRPGAAACEEAWSGWRGPPHKPARKSLSILFSVEKHGGHKNSPGTTWAVLCVVLNHKVHERYAVPASISECSLTARTSRNGEGWPG